MPIYLYRCEDCEKKPREYWQEYDDPPPVCEKCGKAKGRVICSVPTHFKGDGWSNKYNDIKVQKPVGAK